MSVYICMLSKIGGTTDDTDVYVYIRTYAYCPSKTLSSEQWMIYKVSNNEESVENRRRLEEKNQGLMLDLSDNIPITFNFYETDINNGKFLN